MTMKRYAFLLVIIGLMACGGVSSPAAPSAAPTQPPTPADTAIAPSPTPALPTLARLTESGCCADPSWSADGRTVLFVDKPTDADPAGIYGIDVSGGPEKLVSRQVGQLSADGKFLAFLDDKRQTVIRQLDGAVDHIIQNSGQRPEISPGDKRAAWSFSTQVDATIGNRVDLFASNIDGSDQRSLLTIYDGGIAGWLDDDHLLVGGRKSASPGPLILFSIDVTSGAQVDIASETRMRDVSIAPGGKWIAYAVTFDKAQPPDDGLWVVSADGQSKARLGVIGPARWRDDHRLLVIPLDYGSASHRLWQFDAATGQGANLTDPAALPFKVEGGIWRVSPDGGTVVFMNQADHALWLMRLPD